MPGGSLGDVDDVKEKDCRNDKIIHKLENWSETGNIVDVLAKKKLNLSEMGNCASSFHIFFPRILFCKILLKYLRYLSLPLLVDIFQYFCSHL